MERLSDIVGTVLADVSAKMSRNEKDAAFARQSGRKVAGDEASAPQRSTICPAEVTRPAARAVRPKTAGEGRRIVPQE